MINHRLVSGFRESSGFQKIYKNGEVAFYGLPEKGPIQWVHIAKAFVPLEYLFHEDPTIPPKIKRSYSSIACEPFESETRTLPIIPPEEWCQIPYLKKKTKKRLPKRYSRDKRKRSRIPKKVKQSKYIAHSDFLFEKDDVLWEGYDWDYCCEYYYHSDNNSYSSDSRWWFYFN